MLSMISISAPQNNRTCFKNNITSTKLAKQKLSKFVDGTHLTMSDKNLNLLKFINSCSLPANQKAQAATGYLANEVTKTNSSKMAAEKHTKFAEIL